MPILLFFVALAPAARAEAQAQPWVAVDTTADSADYLDTSIRVIGVDLIEIRSKREYTVPRAYQREMFDVMMVRWRVRCSMPHLTVLAEELYKGRSLVRRSSGSAARRRWYAPHPDSWEDALIRRACLLAQDKEPAEDR
jgi:hypothetical protein